MAAADFCNGTSPVLDFRAWTFLNADLTVNFSREPAGDWILLDAESWIGPDGAGLAMARLADERRFSPRHPESGRREALTSCRLFQVDRLEAAALVERRARSF